MFPHITDDEFKDAAGRIEHRYEVHLPPPARPHPEGRLTHVDQLGYGRWMTDYLTARARGLDHEQAAQEMERAIDQAGGVITPPPPPVESDRIVGALRIDGTAFVDDGQ